MRVTQWKQGLMIVSMCWLPSCASHSMRVNTLGTACGTAGPRLTESWRELNDALQTPGGCAADNGLRCDALRFKIERLALDCPNNPDVVMANALLAFSERNFVRSQQLLDELFALRVVYPEASVLRARIALEQGNAPFALRFLSEQIRQSGDHAGLRETFASALFATGRWDDAQAQLEIARQLGAPVWRVAYGLGLIEESKGRLAEAKLRYQEALDAKPGWKQAESRLRTLTVTGKS